MSAKETIEEAAKRCFEEMKALNPKGGLKEFIRMAVNFGSEWQAERSYSEEEIKSVIKISYGLKYFSEDRFFTNLRNLKKQQ
jgi:hypothetical protein